MTKSLKPTAPRTELILSWIASPILVVLSFPLLLSTHAGSPYFWRSFPLDLIAQGSFALEGVGLGPTTSVIVVAAALLLGFWLIWLLVKCLGEQDGRYLDLVVAGLYLASVIFTGVTLSEHIAVFVVANGIIAAVLVALRRWPRFQRCRQLLLTGGLFILILYTGFPLELGRFSFGYY